METTAPETSKKSPTPELKFVYTIHSQEYVGKVLEAVADCDALAIEWVGGSHEKRLDLMFRANDISCGRVSPEKLEEALQYFKNKQDDWDYRLIKGLYGSNKLILPIDASGTQELRELEEKEVAEYDAYYNSLGGPIRTSLEVLGRHIDSTAAVYGFREQEVAEQIKSWLENKASQSAQYKIAVVQGSAHVATSTYLRKQGYKSNREFINWDPERHSLKFAFSYFNEAVRTKVLHPEIEIPLSMKEHVLLESYYGIFVLGDEPKAKNEARQNIATLGDEEVHEVLEGLDPLMQNTKKAWMLAFRLRRHLKKRVERTPTH